MPNGSGLFNAYNQNVGETEKNIPPTNDVTAESFDSKKANLLDKIQHAKIGTLVAYTKGQGTIVKKDGAYLTVFNEAAGEYDQVHVGETYIPGDMISMGVMNQLWDQMQQEVRMGLLSKANIQQPLHFVSRSWNELPRELREVIKEHAKYNSSVPGKADDYYKGVPIKELGTIGRQMYDKEQEEKREKENKLNDKKVSKDVNYGKHPDATEPQLGEEQGDISREHRSHNTPSDGYIGSVIGKPKIKDPKLRTNSGASLDNKKTLKSDVEHGLYGGVVSTDTNFDAEDEYEEDHREGDRKQVKYDRLKEPEAPEPTVVRAKEKVNKYNRLGSKNPFDRNLIRRQKDFVNKNNTRYGMRQASDEEVENFFLNKFNELDEELKAKREPAPGANDKVSVEHRYGGGYGNSGMRRTFMPGDKKIIGTYGNRDTSFDRLHNAKENKKETTEPKSAVGRARKYYDLDGNQISAKEYKEQFG